MGEELIHTEVDNLIEILKKKKKVDLSLLAKELKVSEETVQQWVDFLVEENIVSMEYDFTKPIISLINQKDEEPILDEPLQVNQDEKKEVSKPVAPKHYFDEEQTKKAMDDIKKQIFINIKKEEVVNAIINYRKLKAIFENYPNSRKEEKKELKIDLLSFYNQILKLKEKIDKKDELERKKELEDMRPKEKKLYLEDIKTLFEKIKEDINNKKYKEAKTKIIELKHKTSLIPENYINIKNYLTKVTASLTHKLEFEKKINTQV